MGDGGLAGAEPANWEERTAVRLGPGGYDLSSHRSCRGSLDAIVEAGLGLIAGLRILHLQCHIGDASIALAQRGAREVVGVDFSAAAASQRRARVSSRWISMLPRTSLPRRPAHSASSSPHGLAAGCRSLGAGRGQFPRPGGNLYFADLHPIAAVFDGLGDAADMPAGG